jgi:hypothetical protein
MTVTAKLDGRQVTNHERLANLRYVESSHIDYIGWPVSGEPLMLVRFKSGELYGYIGVSRQRAVAVANAKSPGRYLAREIKPKFKAMKITL